MSQETALPDPATQAPSSRVFYAVGMTTDHPLPEGTRILDAAELDGFPTDDDTPGFVFLGPEAGAAAVRALLNRLGERPGPWSPVMVGEGGRAVPMSPGFGQPLADLVKKAQGEDSQAGSVSFRIALKDLSRIRHDINNPLTAALAEVQLALMDLEPGSDSAEGMEVVERQLRRIRDLAADLVAYRVDRS